MLFVAYRAYVSERLRHQSMEFLYEAARTLFGAREVVPALEKLLDQSLNAFKAEVAEVVLVSPSGDADLATTLGPGEQRRVMVPVIDGVGREIGHRLATRGPVLRLRAQDAGGALGMHLVERGAGEVMIAEVRGETRVLGSLLVAHEATQTRRFGRQDLRLLEALATNLGVALAQLDGGPVLLVDADMRQPSLHEVLALPRAPGLSTYLTGQAALDDVVAPTAIPNLCAIPSGPSPVNPAELLASTRLKLALETLGQRFAHIVFDTGPLFGVSDAMILTGQVEGTILVLRQGRAGRDAAQRAIRSLLSVRAHLLGVILNDMDVHGYGYYGYYGYAEHGAHQTPA
jgi:capsular exopolysaccharide synthesis family protein